MASSGLRGTFLSIYTKLQSGYRPSYTYFLRYWLYAMLGVHFVFQSLLIFCFLLQTLPFVICKSTGINVTDKPFADSIIGLKSISSPSSLFSFSVCN